MSATERKGAAPRRYANIPVSTWDELAADGLELAPSPAALYLRLASAPESTRIAGVLRIGRAALAEALGWEVDDLVRCATALENAGKLIADWKARLVVLPTLLAADCSRPGSISTAVMWARELADLPACDLREQIRSMARETIAATGEAWVRAFDSGVDPQAGKPKAKKPDPPGNPTGSEAGNPPGNRPGNPSGNPLYLDPDLSPVLEPEPKSHIPAIAGGFQLESEEPEKRPEKKSDPPRLRYPVEELLAMLASASKGTFLASKAKTGQVIALQRLIRGGLELPDVKLAGEWLAAGGEAWKGKRDTRNIGDLDAWITQARAWRDEGRLPITKTGGIPAPSASRRVPDDTCARLRAQDEEARRDAVPCPPEFRTLRIGAEPDVKAAR